MSYLFDANGEKLLGSFTSTYDVPITISAWVKKDATSWGNVSNAGFVMLSEDFEAGDDSLSLIKTNTADRIQARTRNDVGSNGPANYTIIGGAADDTWILMVGVFTANDLRDVYFNEFANTGSNSNDRALTGTLTQLMLGNFNNGASGHTDGLLAEVCIWKRALVEADINALRTSAQTGPSPASVQSADVIGYWPLTSDNPTQENEGSDASGSLGLSGATFNADHPTITTNSPGIRSSAQASSESANNITVNEPTGALVGDKIYVIVCGNNNVTLADNNGGTPFTKTIQTQQSTESTLAIFERTKESGDPTTYNFTSTATNRIAATAFAMIGDTEYDVTPDGTTDSLSSGSTFIDCVDITTLANDTSHIVVGLLDSNAQTFTAVPSGYIEIEKIEAGERHAVYYKAIPFAGLPDVSSVTDGMGGTNDPLSNNGSWSLSGATAEDGIKEGNGYSTPTEAGSNDSAYYWNARVFTNDQFAQITMVQDNDGANDRIGIMLRAGAGTAGFLVRYRTATADSDFEAYYFTGLDAKTQLTTPTADQGSVDGNNLDPSEAFVAGDIMRVEIVGKTLTLKIDFGSGFVTQGSWDATGVGPESGSAGLYMAGVEAGAAVRGDDFEAGDFLGTGAQTFSFSASVPCQAQSFSIKAAGGPPPPPPPLYRRRHIGFLGG